MVRDYLVSVAIMATLSGIWFAVQRLRQADAEGDHRPACKAQKNHCDLPCHCTDPKQARS